MEKNYELISLIVFVWISTSSPACLDCHKAYVNIPIFRNCCFKSNRIIDYSISGLLNKERESCGLFGTVWCDSWIQAVVTIKSFGNSKFRIPQEYLFLLNIGTLECCVTSRRRIVNVTLFYLVHSRASYPTGKIQRLSICLVIYFTHKI